MNMNNDEANKEIKKWQKGKNRRNYAISNYETHFDVNWEKDIENRRTNLILMVNTLFELIYNEKFINKKDVKLFKGLCQLIYDYDKETRITPNKT